MPIIYKNTFLEEIDEPEDLPLVRSVSVPAFPSESENLVPDVPDSHMVEHGPDLSSSEFESKGMVAWADITDLEFEDDQRMAASADEQKSLSGGGRDEESVNFFQTRKFGSSDARLRSTSKRATSKAKAFQCKAPMVKAPMAKTSKAFRDKQRHLPKRNMASSVLQQHAQMKCSRTMTSKEDTDEKCWICGSAYCRPSECQHESAPAMRESRFTKRRRTIDEIKGKLHYILYMQNVAKDQRTIRAPMTPPAEDIYDVPTRMWKQMTLKWDKQLKQREWGLDAIHIEPEMWPS